ncbi:hypothetical protein C6502_21800 [Candidatus Poribacteria bacterium]|nr:MAG: hypothetical protein C6502_21800 [Candidatus Poribacteria bacterium]
MKLCKLKLKNLNSFRGEIELDFEKSPLDEASLVAITGPTGAGKTTLLDAICVALYGRTPRLTGVGTQNPSHLISHGENDAYSEVHFEANNTRHLAEWSLRRNSSPKGQLRCTENDELISDRLSARGKSLGSSENTISEEIANILGLDFDAFKRSVMLAQGEFAAFLKAKDEERRTILEATAGVGIYEELKKTLNEKVRAVRDEQEEVLNRLNTIPAASREQLAEVEAELGSLQASSQALSLKNEKIQKEQEQEKKREEEFAELQTSEERRDELLNKQPMIEALEVERERADRANRLLPEKQAFDTSKSELEKTGEALRQAKIELAEAQKQFDENQVDFGEKDEAYQITKTVGERKTETYREAKSDVERAHTQFQLVEERRPRLQELEEQINILSTELIDKRQQQASLEEDTHKVETFLAENPLPSDRQSHLTQAKELLVELRSQRQQQDGKSNSQSEHTSEIDRLEGELKKLSKNREKLLVDKENAEAALGKVDTELKTFQETGNLEAWQNQREKARQSLSIAQGYEFSHDQLRDKKRNAAALQEQIAALDGSLNDVKETLEVQFHLCKRAEAEVTRLEAEKELALLANPINQLRRQLEPGQPCRVCGATEHPCADEVELGSEEQLEIVQNALDAAETEARDTQAYNKKLEQDQVRLQQDKTNITSQIDTCMMEIEILKEAIESARTQWQALYEMADISSEWVGEKINEAETAIENLSNARNAYNQASNDLKIVSEKLTTCERDIVRENNLLEDNQKKLRAVTAEIENLNVDIEDSETRFWKLLPDSFHGIGIEDAVNQFADKIETVAAHEQERDKKQNELEQCNIVIREGQKSLETERENHEKLQAEIASYQSEGNGFLDTARGKTSGLITEVAIDTAIEKLHTTIQQKADQREEAGQKLQESRDQRTEKQTNHRNFQDRETECGENFEKAHAAYFDKLSSVGFDSPEAHDRASRDDSEMERIQREIDDFNQEKHLLEEAIAKLRAQFEKTPFDSQVLERITVRVEENNEHIHETQQKIVRQQIRIEELTDALSKREALDDEIQTAVVELERWGNLQDVIPANDLRDFALDIMFKQVSRVANVQLEYLTSERYQLKVEGIGKLTIIDRWNANEERPVETLSGGESFLTSLALALALSELSRGRSQIHSLFLDEGFGTLDSETLDVAIAALEGLQMQGRSIFLISHVSELTRRIPVRIAVQKSANGSSQLRVHG